jgi:hypothetical protein
MRHKPRFNSLWLARAARVLTDDRPKSFSLKAAPVLPYFHQYE